MDMLGAVIKSPPSPKGFFFHVVAIFLIIERFFYKFIQGAQIIFFIFHYFLNKIRVCQLLKKEYLLTDPVLSLKLNNQFEDLEI